MARQVNEHDKLIGKRLRAARLSAGLTQPDLADRIGVKFQQVQKYETGLNRICASRLFLACDYLKVDITHFANATAVGCLLDDPAALTAAHRVAAMPAHMKDSALRVLGAMVV